MWLACCLWQPDKLPVTSLRPRVSEHDKQFYKKIIQKRLRQQEHIPGSGGRRKGKLTGAVKCHVATWVENVFMLDVKINHIAHGDFMRLHEIAEQPSLIKQQLAWCSVFTRCDVLPKCSYLNDKSHNIPLSSPLPMCTSLLQCCVSQPCHKNIYISSSLWVFSVFSVLEVCSFEIKSLKLYVLLIWLFLYRVQYWNSSYCTHWSPVKNGTSTQQTRHIVETWKSQSLQKQNVFSGELLGGISTRWWHFQLCHSFRWYWGRI